MAGGRPQEYDRVLIADRLIEWAKKEDSININKFCALHDPIIPATTMLNWVREDAQFRKAYESARMFLAFRREEWLGSELLHVKAYDLNATVYDAFMRDEKRNQQQFESDLRQKEIAQATEQDKAQKDAIIEQINAAQKAFLGDK